VKLSADNQGLVAATAAMGSLGPRNTYFVVKQGSNVEIYFDDYWGDIGGRIKVATLVGVDINDIDVTDFGVYGG
jgi:hypothetical protein